MTTVTGGDLQVDGVIGDVTLNGAGVSLSGTGNVGDHHYRPRGRHRQPGR